MRFYILKSGLLILKKLNKFKNIQKMPSAGTRKRKMIVRGMLGF
jgi:hypothetical protein